MPFTGIATIWLERKTSNLISIFSANFTILGNLFLILSLLSISYNFNFIVCGTRSFTKCILWFVLIPLISRPRTTQITKPPMTFIFSKMLLVIWALNMNTFYLLQRISRHVLNFHNSRFLQQIISRISIIPGFLQRIISRISKFPLSSQISIGRPQTLLLYWYWRYNISAAYA